MIDELLSLHGMIGAKVMASFGGGLDGELNTVGDVNFAVPTVDVSTIVKRYSSVRINAGHKVTVDKRCRGLFIFSESDVTIDGIIDMSSKSALVDGGPGYLILKVAKLLQGALTDPIAQAIVFGPGGAGGNGGGASLAGGIGSGGFWFGGGRGGGGKGGNGDGTYYPGIGAAGGSAGYNALTSAGGIGGEFPTAGANGSGGGGCTPSGSGNGGSSANGSGAGGGGGRGGSGSGVNGSNGTGWGGGLVCIIARGNVIIGSTGKILANGANGANGGAGGTSGGDGSYGGNGGGGGGGNGGGLVYVLHRGTLTNGGQMQVNGGNGGTGGVSDTAGRNGTNGAAGGIGKIVTQQI